MTRIPIRATRCALFLLAAVLAAALPLPRTAAAQGTNVALGSRIAANRCMDVVGGARAQGTRLQIWECNGTEAQKYTFSSTGEIRVFGTLCVDAYGGQGRAGDPMVIWPCNGSANQKWTLTGAGELRGINGRCIDVVGGRSATGTALQLWDCNGTAAQKWNVGGSAPVAPPAPPIAPPAPQPAYQPAPLPSGVVSLATRLDASRCLDVVGGARAQGTRTQIWTCNGTDAQKLSFTTAGDVRVFGTMCLDAYGGRAADGDPVVIWPCNGTASQKWTLTTTGEMRGIGGKCLDLDGANTREGSPIAIYGCHGQNNQKWNPRAPAVPPPPVVVPPAPPVAPPAPPVVPPAPPVVPPAPPVVPPAPPVAGVAAIPVYRWHAPDVDWHVYTRDPQERPVGARPEAVAFGLFPEGTAGTRQLVRLLRPDGGQFFTANPVELESVVRVGMRVDSDMGNVATTQLPGTLPLHRFLKPGSGRHFYTLDRSEGDRAGFVYEGVAGYALPAPAGVALPAAFTATLPAGTPPAPVATGFGVKSIATAASARPEEAAVRYAAALRSLTNPATNTIVLLASQVAPNRCMDVTGGVMRQGTRLQLWECNATGAQQFYFQGDGRLRTLSGFCVEAAAGGANGTAVVLWPCLAARDANQRWTWTELGQLRGAGGRCIDLPQQSPATGTVLHLWDCADRTSQKWDPADRVRNPGAPALVPGAAVSLASGVGVDYCAQFYRAPQNLYLGKCSKNDWQTFVLQPSGQIRGVGPYANLCLQVRGSTSRDGAEVGMGACADRPSHQWKAGANGQVTGWGGRCLDAKWNAFAERTVILWTCNGGNNQRWNALDLSTFPEPLRTIGRFAHDTEKALARPAGDQSDCFGPVGMRCAGVAMGPLTLAPAVRNADGSVTMWVSVGSILHDNCCMAVGPSGQHCDDGQFGRDFLTNFLTGEVNHNGQCVWEWKKAAWAAYNRHQWQITIDPNLPNDYTLVVNPRQARLYNDSQSQTIETRTTRRMAAPSGTFLDYGDGAYCASGQWENLSAAPARVLVPLPTTMDMMALSQRAIQESAAAGKIRCK